jgi:hypothetical protein
MALYEIIEVKKVNIMGHEHTFKNKTIKHVEGTTYGFKPGPNLISSAARLFKYEYEHPYFPPTLVEIKGQMFIVPTWQKVHSKTTLKDIEWIKPEKPQAPKEKNTWRFESASDPGTFYFVKQSGNKLTCTCSGSWRAKDRRCKHIKEVEQRLS